jgi:hypothetical protein
VKSFIILVFICYMSLQAQWTKIDSLLFSNFDFYEPFDYLQDWQGYVSTASIGDIFILDYPNDFPVKLNGTPSGWGYYSMWSSGSSTNDWIAAHGQSNVWRGNKSLCIDYSDDDGIQGPSRFGIYLGNNSPTSGYSAVYIFYMLKFDKGFFPYIGNNCDWYSYHKTLEVTTGFRDIGNWGTVIQQNSAHNDVQNRHLYGLNMLMMNTSPYGGDVFLYYNIFTAHGGGCYYDFEYNGFGNQNRSAIENSILNSEHFGVEFYYKLSSPVDASNGIVEFWVYHTDGTLLGHDALTGIVTLRDADCATGLGDHKINKYVWGGNRYTPEFSAATQGHHYVDDIIINDSRIGPTYFEIIQGGTIPPIQAIPDTVKNLDIVPAKPDDTKPGN